MDLEDAPVSQPDLHIQVLGDFSLTYGGEPLTSLIPPRLQSLLVYLLIHRGIPQSRQHLAFLFWPDLPEDRARNNLRQALHLLRQILPKVNHFLETDTLSVYWRLDSSFRLDVADFEKALVAAGAAEHVGNLGAFRSALERAVSLYRGDLLPSCYEDWIFSERERLHQKCLVGLERIILLLEGQREYPTAIRYAQQLIRHDPLYENGYRMLMQLYALNHDRASALRTYQACAGVLQRELGVEPEQATREIYDRLLNASTSFPETLQDSDRNLPMVGRGNAWTQLLDTWRQAAAGNPHFVLLMGEAGVGKTRLGEELFEWATRQGLSTARTRAYAAEGRLSYDPIIDWLRSVACRTAIHRLEKVWLTELARLLPELLAETPDLPPPEPLTEHWQRQKFFQALARAILGAQQPLLLVFDDLQWCDPETLELLHYLLRADPKARLLLIGTVRIEEMVSNRPLQDLLSDLRSNALSTEITIKPLDAAETSRLAAYVADRELDSEATLRLFRETEGNPLFILETVRSGFLSGNLASGAAQPNEAGYPFSLDKKEGLPPKVRAVIATRLAQLSAPARELAWLAATTGRAFTFQVLAEASGASEDDLAHWLEELWQRRIVREQGANTYDFSHDKIREVAYAEISPPARPLLHRRVARALEKIYVSDLDPVSGQLAVHFERAGMPEQAIPFYHRAAMVVQRVGANEEAILILEKALELHQMLAEGPERDRFELDLQMALGVSLVISRGYSSPEAIRAYDRAQALCQRLGRPPSPPILRALALANIAEAEFGKSLGFGAQLLEQAENQSNSSLEVEAHFVLGVSLFWTGSFVQAREHLAEAIRLYQPQQSRTHILLYSQDPKAICLSRLAFDLWCLGYPSQAVEASQEALAYASELGHPFSLGYVMFWDAMLHNHLRSFSLTVEKTKNLVALAQETRLAQWLPFGLVMQGWARAEQGELEPGISLIREGLEGSRSLGIKFLLAFFQSLLAEQFGRKGDINLGIALLTEAQAMIEQQGERWCEAELHRRLGELLSSKADEVNAEVAFQRAIEIAHSQEARMLELRAAVPLARLWRKQGKISETQRLLAPLFAWFREGFDESDLLSARELLEN
jgi:DNA-binding SARP family transcriptional activator/predicted ATPase